MDQLLNDLVRAAGGDPDMVGDPVAYLLSTIAERDSLRLEGKPVPGKFEIQHGGTIQIQHYSDLRGAYKAAYSVKCARPTQILMEVSPNCWETVLELHWKGGGASRTFDR